MRALLAAVFIHALLAAPARADRPVEIRIATLAPSGSSWARATDKAAREIEKRTQGRVKLKVSYGGALGDERDFVRKMRRKEIDGVAVASIGLGQLASDVKVLDLPLLLTTEKEVDAVRAGLEPVLEKRLADAGFVVVMWSETGWVRLFTSVPLNGLADLKRLKIWSWADDPVSRALFRRMGVAGVPLGVPEVLPALEKGRINACYGSVSAALMLGWHARIRYASANGLVMSTAALVVRKDVLDALAPADRDVLGEVGRSLGAELTESVRRDEQKARKAMEQAGIRFVTYPPELWAELDRQSRGVWDELAGTVYSKETLELTKKLAAKARASR